MKKILLILIPLVILVGGGGGTAWYIITYHPEWLPRTLNSVQEEAVIDEVVISENTEPELSAEEQSLIDLINQYDYRKNDVSYLQRVAGEFLQRRQVKKAEKYVSEALALDPLQSRSVGLQVKIYLLENRINEAQVFLANSPDDSGEVSFMKALTAILLGNRDEAGRQLHNIVDSGKDPNIVANAQKIIDAYREFDFFRDGQLIHLQTLLARSMNQIDEPQLAIYLLRGVLDEKSDYRDAWLLLGYAYFNLQQYSQSEDAFLKAYSLDSEKPETQYFLGLIYSAMKNYAESERFFEYALINSFEPKIQVYQRLAEVYLKNDRYDKAVKMYENFLALLPERHASDFVQPISLYLNNLKEPQNALRIAEQVAEALPEEAESYTLLAWSQIEGGNLTEAQLNLEKAAILAPALPSVFLNYGRLYEALGDLDKAKENYKKAYDLSRGTEEGNVAAELYNKLIR
jgi:tetratricopeptide (TPR) repeat protein